MPRKIRVTFAHPPLWLALLAASLTVALGCALAVALDAPAQSGPPNWSAPCAPLPPSVESAAQPRLLRASSPADPAAWLPCPAPGASSRVAEFHAPSLPAAARSFPPLERRPPPPHS